MTRFLSILLFVALGCLSGFSQTASTWQYEENNFTLPAGGSYHFIERVPGNGYLLAGSFPLLTANSNVPFLTRLNDQGQELWNRRYDFFNGPPFHPGGPGAGSQFKRIIPTDDGGFICGLSASAGEWFAKFNSAGDTLWTRKFPSGMYYEITNFAEMPNGNLLYNVAPTQGFPGFIDLKMRWHDASGTPLDSASYTGLPYNLLTGLTARPDHGFYLSGFDSTYNFSATRFDSAGTILWTTGFYTHTLNRPASPVGVELAPDSGLTVAVRRPRGNVWPANYQAAFEFHHLTQGGSVDWNITLPDAFGVTVTYFPATLTWTYREDGAILALLRDSLSTHLMAISGTGAPLWNRILPDPPGFVRPTYSDVCRGIENSNGFASAGAHIAGNIGHAFGAAFDSLGDYNYVLMQGRVFSDSLSNCTQDVGEPGLPNCLLLDNLGNPVAVTDPNGFYDFVGGIGTHTFTAHPVANNWAPIWDINCPPTDSHSVSYSGVPAIDTVSGLDFAMEQLLSCPVVVVDVSTPVLRPCIQATYYVNYCNHGTATANNAYVVLALDSALTGFNTALPFTTVGQDSFQVNLGNLLPGQCGQFQFTTMPPCVQPFVPFTHCVTAHAFPDSLCGPPPAAWNGARVEVNGWCQENDTVWFQVRNAGTAAMSGSSGIWVVEDDILRQTGQIQLNAGQDSTFFVVANGSTWTTLVDQVPNYPWPSIPRATVEACGLNGQGGVSTGFVNDFEDDDRHPWLSIDCQQLTAAVDPNDKTGFPQGFGANRQIYANGEMEYRIRFQNTGTDTAFTVIIKDTLPPHLDASTFVSGASSHSYSVSFLPGNAVRWTFNNILLPDSTTDEPASHGFVKFRIMQRPNLSPGTRIENKAGIIFDFMPPVITNLAFHTIGELQLMVNIDAQPDDAIRPITVYPNPCLEVAHFDLGAPRKDVRLQLYDLNGRLLRSINAGHARNLRLDRDGLPAGLYVFRITAQQQAIGSGKLIVGSGTN